MGLIKRLKNKLNKKSLGSKLYIFSASNFKLQLNVPIEFEDAKIDNEGWLESKLDLIPTIDYKITFNR